MNDLQHEGPKYAWSVAATAEIINLHLHSDDPPAVIFSRILYTILRAMHRADEELNAGKFTPSEN